MSLEKKVVELIEWEVRHAGGYLINVHGSNFSSNGTPDIIAYVNGHFLGIEAKKRHNKPSIAQYGHGLDIISSGGRFIIAYEDFDLQKILDGSVPIWSVPRGVDKFTLYDQQHLSSRTTELRFIES